LVVIRKARADDAATLAAIGYRAWEDKLSVWTEGLSDIGAIRDNARLAYETFTRDYWPAILVSEDQGRIVGWGAREHPGDVLDHRDNAISDLWIDPERQGRGHGTALLAALEDEIGALGFANALLETHARNHSAIAFYKARGYRVSWLSTKYSASLDRDIEKVGMEKELAAKGDEHSPAFDLEE
jgi:ribosomal-protein-alanine N-acetyltransferase